MDELLGQNGSGARRPMSGGWLSQLGGKVRLTGRRTLERVSVRLGRGHVLAPTTLGEGPHDCALTSLYWAAPRLTEERIREAFQFCAKNWPYGGVTNTEFAVALKYLEVDHRYFGETESLDDLLSREPTRCVALLPYHFIAVLHGRIVGRDAHRAWDPATTVYCSWMFR